MSGVGRVYSGEFIKFLFRKNLYCAIRNRSFCLVFSDFWEKFVGGGKSLLWRIYQISISEKSL
ncbi:MAG: hypothetical protein AB4080_02690, partial [Trichodesmium sp.]